MDYGLKGRCALVTGASRGMGRAIASLLAAEGANVALVARDPEILEATASRIRETADGEVLAISGDVSAADTTTAVIATLEEKWGRLDILVNNGGGPPPGSFLDHDDMAWQNAIDLNLMSVIRFTRTAVPLMKAGGWGRIVNITSTLAKEPTSGMVLSATARAGVSAFSKAVAAEIAPMGITINTVCPGGVRTDRLVSLFETMAEQQEKSAEALIEGAVASIPMGRFAEPEEFAQFVVFLTSERAGYITGTTLSVDGGLTKGVY